MQPAVPQEQREDHLFIHLLMNAQTFIEHLLRVMLGVGIWEETSPRCRAIGTGQAGPRLARNVLREEQETDPTLQRVFLSAPWLLKRDVL